MKKCEAEAQKAREKLEKETGLARDKAKRHSKDEELSDSEERFFVRQEILR